MYGYALQNPGRFIDPRGEACIPCAIAIGMGVRWGAKKIGQGIAAALAGKAISDGINEMAGNAPYPWPYTHDEEDLAKDYLPEGPNYGPEECERLKWAIWVLRANIAWRIADLNPNSPPVVIQNHKTRIAILTAKLNMLEALYELHCGGPCPW